MTSALRDRITELAEERGINGFRALSHRTGGDISHETARRILTGRATHIRQATLDALAFALEVSADELVASSLGADADTPWQLREEFDQVAVDMRPDIERALLALFRAGRILPPARRTSHADRI